MNSTQTRVKRANPLTSTRTAENAVELLEAMAAVPAGHPSRAALRDRAIEAWLPMARHLAHRYAGRGEPTDDLVQTAIVGLIKAVDRFDPDRGVDFAGFAIPTIVGEIKRHFRDRTWSIRVPRRLQELRLAITAANSALTHTLGRSPTVADVAAHLEHHRGRGAGGPGGCPRLQRHQPLHPGRRGRRAPSWATPSAARTTSSSWPSCGSRSARRWPASTSGSRGS